MILASCGSSIGSVEPIKELGGALARPPAAMTAPCPDHQELGTKGLSAGDVLSKWSRDRASLADCRDRKTAVQAFYEGRDAALAGLKR